MWSKLKPTYWRRYGHIPVMILLQIIFIILFGKFVVYNPENAGYTPDTKTGLDSAAGTMTTYPRKCQKRLK